MEADGIKGVISTQEFIQRYWLEAVFGGILFVFGVAIKYLYAQLRKEFSKRTQQLEKESAEQDLIKKGVLAILHDRLYCECQRLIEKGSATVAELNNLKHIYVAYHSLGGNGTGTELYMRCLKLKIERK